MLAFYTNPYSQFVEKAVREYNEKELSDPETVKQLFDYCQILCAYITQAGWTFLINHYGWETLFKINKLSGWLDAESPDDFKACVESAIEDAKAFDAL